MTERDDVAKLRGITNEGGAMISGKEGLLESLIEAFIMEKGTSDFYKYTSEKSLSREAKKAFKALEQWESKHMDYIQFLYKSLMEDHDLLSFETFKDRVPALVVEGGIPVSDLEERMEEYTSIDDTGAIMLALEIEGKAYNLYRRLSETADDSNAKVFMKEMMEQELEHIDYLKDVKVKIAETS